MHPLSCPSCRSRVYFDNDACLGCGALIAFDDGRMAMVALRPAQPLSRLRYLAVASKPVTLLCDNSKLDACNWTVDADKEGGHCRSCALNHTIPNLDKTENQDAWRMFEV